MILIDAIFINNGGGKVLLDYLVSKLEQTDLKIFYLFDDRIQTSYNIKESNLAIYQNSGLKLRSIFYKKYQNMFSSVLILGNIPPPIRLKKTKVFTYFHNPMLLDVPNDFTIVEKAKYLIKVKILKIYSENTDYWLLQSNILKQQFITKFNQRDKVRVLPFYPTLKSEQIIDISRKKGTMIYVSNAQANKNHIRLINAFCKSYDVVKQGKLILTVSDKFPSILQLIEKVVSKGYPIVNIGFVDRETLTQKYLESEYVIFPSLAESFGLGLIEGIELGCKIVGADLPYTYAVCEPSLVFDPNDTAAISNSINVAMTQKLKKAKLIVDNKIDELINILR